MAGRIASRRGFVKAAGAGILATTIGANIFIPRRIHAAKKTLKILQWVHFESPAAVANAVAAATGLRVTSLPITAEKIALGLLDARAGGA